MEQRATGQGNEAHTLLGAIHLLRSHRGGRGVKEVANFANDSTDRLREIANKGGGGPKCGKFCERNKWMPHNYNRT